MRAHRRRPFDLLVVAASRDLGRLIETGVPSGVTAVLVGSVQTDLEHTAAADVARGV